MEDRVIGLTSDTSNEISQLKAQNHTLKAQVKAFREKNKNDVHALRIVFITFFVTVILRKIAKQ